MCPFAVPPTDTYVLELHFEQEHTPDSPFRIIDDPEALSLPAVFEPSESSKPGDVTSDEDDDNYVLCPRPDCGEDVLLADLNDHLNFHAAESLTVDDEADTGHPKMQTLTEESTSSFLQENFTSEVPDAPRHTHRKKIKRKRGSSSASEKSILSRSILNFIPFSAKFAANITKQPASSVRLGRAELGPHAWEDKMPKWLHRQLEEGPKITMMNRIGRDGRLVKEENVQNETPGVIPILAQLSALDRSVKEAYYCHPSTLHIGKTPKEGGFCGYRNIQMLISYIQGARAQGHDEFPGRTPGILKLQDLIETAWDKGINEIGRQQTGGIRDTRKYIGTPEAQALFLNAQIDCAVDVFNDSPDGQLQAHEQLFLGVEKYFQQAAIEDGSNVYKTLLPPIYMQQPGHSLSIIGFERRKDGTCNLICFDPMFHTSPSMHRLRGRKHLRSSRPEVMQAYRRTARQLRRHAAFEVLMLTAHPPLFPAWDV